MTNNGFAMIDVPETLSRDWLDEDWPVIGVENDFGGSINNDVS